MLLTGSPTRWEQMLDQPLERRLEPAPEELVNLVAQHNASTSVAVEPRPASPAADLLADVRAAVEELPQVIKSHLEPRLLGIFFMSGIGSSAITTLVAYANGDLLGAVVVLDAEVFSQPKANAWATWRENTAFSPAPDVRLEVRIADDDADDRKAALQYVLLHEFGHVMASASEVMPNWWEKEAAAQPVGPNSFLSLGWQRASDGAVSPIAGQDFPLRAAISLYATPHLTGDRIPSIYEDLDKTVFPTLYAASNPHEDFAESFATYVHTTLMGKPHELHIYREDKPTASYGSFWHTPRSRTKAAFFESFLSGPPNPFPRRQQHAEAAKLCSAIIECSALAFLGLAPFLRLSVASGDLRHVAHELVAQTEEDQDNAVLWMNLSTAFFAVRQSSLGLAMQQQALLRRQEFHLPAAVQPAFCHVLMLMAQGDLAENTPFDCLLECSGVDITMYYATPEAPLPPELPAHDVLMVAMSGTDKNRPLLKTLESQLADWEKPVINRPQCIPRVERNTASVRLQDAPGLLMPLTHQVTREYLESVARGTLMLTETYADCPFPILLRPVGSQAGQNLTKIDDALAIAAYLAAVPDSAFYLSRFIDYSGADGLFRKYRVALIDGQPFACHMEISSHWMIHYVNAGMYTDSAKRAEEAQFMENFPEFANRHRAALDAIYERCGLDYVCIDCAESREGELLVFEVDHVMVVHAMDPEDLFPYKQEHMSKVRTAFEDFLLSRMAQHLSH